MGGKVIFHGVRMIESAFTIRASHLQPSLFFGWMTSPLYSTLQSAKNPASSEPTKIGGASYSCGGGAVVVVVVVAVDGVVFVVSVVVSDSLSVGPCGSEYSDSVVVGVRVVTVADGSAEVSRKGLLFRRLHPMALRRQVEVVYALSALSGASFSTGGIITLLLYDAPLVDRFRLIGTNLSCGDNKTGAVIIRRAFKIGGQQQQRISLLYVDRAGRYVV